MATESDNVNSGALGTLVAVGTIAFFGIALVVTALVRAELSEEVEKKEVTADRAYKDLVSEQRAKLDAPAAYVSRESGLVSLPIDRAMELTVEGLKKDPNSASPPPPVGGSGGTGGAGGSGGAETGGTAAEAGGTSGTGGTAPEGEAKPPEGAAPAPEEKKDEKKKDEKKDGSAKPKPAAVPASAVPGPAQAPAPIPAPLTAP
jgi:hypothetical protein